MELKQVPFEELSTGEEYIRVKVEFSGVNYKDGMAICGIYGVVEKLPLITGIDFVGVVDETKAGFQKGDRVIMTGYDTWMFLRPCHLDKFSIFSNSKMKVDRGNGSKVPRWSCRIRFSQSCMVGSAARDPGPD